MSNPNQQNSAQPSAAKQCPRLSVAMIVRDAEDCLTATLDSVRNLADEIVVLDTGSRDSTIRIARQKATTVLSRPWTDDFSAARNAALDAITGDWVLWLDAGETITPKTAEALRKFVDSQAEPQTAYYLLIRTPAQGVNIAGEQVARLRLHPNGEGLQFAGRVRESLAVSLAQLAWKTEGLSYTIERGSREHDPQVKQSRAQRNLHLARLAMEEEGTEKEGASAWLLNCLGEATQALGDNTASLEFYRQALGQSAPASGDMLEAFYGILTALEGQEESRDAQLQLCMKALATYPLDAQLLCAIGGYLQSKEQLELASRAYQLAAQHGQLNLEIWHLDGLQEIAQHCYAVTLQMLGRDDEAIQLLQTQLAANPDAARLRRQLLEIHVRLGQRDEALDVVNNMPRNIPNREALRSAVRGACLAATGNWINGKTYLETAYKAGCREPLCLRWLTSSYLAAGNLNDAAATLEQWSRIEPLSAEVRQYRRELEAGLALSDGKRVRLDDAASSSAVPAPIRPAAHAARSTNAAR
jgi:tetratricopeptide (TPR) repeat protein